MTFKFTQKLDYSAGCLHCSKISFVVLNCLRYSNLIFSTRYIEEHILKTGVAIETQGFAFVTSGKKRETLTVSDPKLDSLNSNIN